MADPNFREEILTELKETFDGTKESNRETDDLIRIAEVRWARRCWVLCLPVDRPGVTHAAPPPPDTNVNECTIHSTTGMYCFSARRHRHRRLFRVNCCLLLEARLLA